MDSLKKMNEALNYIEENLTSDIDFKEMARRAVCSEYHFKRMFSFLAGVTLSEYIRCRRLTMAAFEIKENDKMRIIDLAIKYGYSSADSFTRAFKRFHGIIPSEARNNDRSLKAFPAMTFQLSIKGGKSMNYRIVEKEAFSIVGIMKRVPIVFKGTNPEINSMWKKLDDEMINTLKQLSNIELQGIIQVSANFSEGRMEEKGELDHYIGVATTKDYSGNLASLEVPALTWAVFESVGPFPDTLQDTWGRIYVEWFPSSNYEIAEGPEILWNESKDTSSEKYKSEIWIPVVKK
ncbi:MAG: AraC family transcriptional regulator [Firmicutes bacterium]|nr:AraC family transcriptional regulator [Bacillota bacterium]